MRISDGSSDVCSSDLHLDILRTYRMIAEDRGWIGRIREAIRSGLTAEAAVAQVQTDTRARMQPVRDPYLSERLLDLDRQRVVPGMSASVRVDLGGRRNIKKKPAL